MRSLITITLALCVHLSALAAVRAQSQTPRTGRLGLGLIMGNPIGATGKYWINPTQAVDAGVGYSGDLAFYADYLWHGWKVFPQPREGELAGRMGLGIRVEDSEFAFRAMPGVDYWLAGYPVEVFAELGPVFRVTPGRSVSMDAGIGFRYYFNRFN
jgi:hypothetical protein